MQTRERAISFRKVALGTSPSPPWNAKCCCSARIPTVLTPERGAEAQPETPVDITCEFAVVSELAKITQVPIDRSLVCQIPAGHDLGNTVAATLILHLEVGEAALNQFCILEQGEIVEVNGNRMYSPAPHEFREDDAAHWLIDIRQFYLDVAAHGASHRLQHAPDDRWPCLARPAKYKTI